MGIAQIAQQIATPLCYLLTVMSYKLSIYMYQVLDLSNDELIKPRNFIHVTAEFSKCRAEFVNIIRGKLWTLHIIIVFIKNEPQTILYNGNEGDCQISNGILFHTKRHPKF